MEPALAMVVVLAIVVVGGGVGIWLLVRPKKEEDDEVVPFALPPPAPVPAAAPAAAAPIYLSYPDEAPSRGPVQVRTSDAKVVVVPPPAAPPVSIPLPLMVPTFSQPVISAPRPPSVQVVGFPTTQPPAIPLQVKPKGKCGLGTTWDSGKKICRAPKTPVVASTTTAAAPKKGGCAEGRTWDKKQMKCRLKSVKPPGTPSGKPPSSNKSKGCATGKTWDSKAGKCREVCGPGKSYNASTSKCIDKQSLAGLRLADQLKKMKPDTPAADLEKIKAMRDSEVEVKRKELGLADTKCNIGPTILFDYMSRVETTPGQKDWHCPVGWSDTGCDWGDAAGDSESRHCKKRKSEERRMPVPGSSPGASIPSGSAVDNPLIKAINAIGAIGDGFGAVLGGSDEAAHRLAAYNAST